MWRQDAETAACLDVVEQLAVVHGAVAHGNAQAEHLLQLELDGALHLLYLRVQEETQKIRNTRANA